MSGRSRRSSPLHFSDTEDDAPIGGGRQHDDDDLDFAPPPRIRRHRADTDAPAAANNLAPPVPTFAHDMASARRELVRLMADQGHQAIVRHVNDGGGVDDLG
jgi:hypothetical protein